MNTAKDKPDTERILGTLKDFQRKTVEYVYRRLYTDHDCTNRFLIADEVGLGKTLVARGLIAKVVDSLWGREDRIDILYICSNSDIARQNSARLNLADSQTFTPPDRSTLLPLHIHQMRKGQYLNFIALTPGTSFDLRSRGGISTERALLYRALREAWGFGDSMAPVNVLACDMDCDNFRGVRDWVMKEVVEEGILKAFVARVAQYDAKQTGASGRPLRERFRELCEIYVRKDSRVTPDIESKRKALIGELRSLLARTCIKWLKPDLVILDEFQRFKHLMDTNNPDGQLFRELIEYSNEHQSSRVVLLSATPYKMYTLQHEEDSGDHYSDFVQTVKFLFNDASKTEKVEKLLDSFSAKLRYRVHDGDAGLFKIKHDLESVLRSVMVRTERLACSSDRNGMLKEIQMPALSPAVADIRHYVDYARISTQLKTGMIGEYWKSAPYLLNFMDEYRFKQLFKQCTESGTDPALRKILLDAPRAFLSHKDIKRYRSIDPCNARLRYLLNDTVGNGMWRFLWMPPSLPYYNLAGKYDQEDIAGFTKRLVFSSWHVVPKVIAALTSYEAERRCTLSFEPNAKNTPQERKRHRPLLRFGFSDNRLTGMPVLGLVYPSAALAEATDPLNLSKDLLEASNPPDLCEIFAAARQRVATLIEALPSDDTAEDSLSEEWYWAAPILMDALVRPDEVRDWFEQEALASKWSGVDPATDSDRESKWPDHVNRARKLLQDFAKGSIHLGKKPANLIDVLTWLGLAGPAACSWRSLMRISAQSSSLVMRNLAGKMGHAFLTLFNLPESLSLVRADKEDGDRKEPYWTQVLKYSADGCLQAVLDEYVHILRESLGRVDAIDETAIADIAAAVSDALRIRTSRVGYDHVIVKPRHHIRVHRQSMRVRFAMRFGQLDAEDGGEPTREDHVRAAFNSPFWPFVLATTSIGQEGLDFHQYCHAVVHWNLPTNPVDLEQREGRVHRYKGHAVRKNIAVKYGLHALKTKDLWSDLFSQAKADSSGGNDIVPFWVYPGRSYVERHVPILPMSNEVSRYADLKRTTALYRLAFGQVRQEELVEFLKEKVQKADRLASTLLLNLEPR